jgi:DNA-binding protein HU-beta
LLRRLDGAGSREAPDEPTFSGRIEGPNTLRHNDSRLPGVGLQPVLALTSSTSRVAARSLKFAGKGSANTFLRREDVNKGQLIEALEGKLGGKRHAADALEAVLDAIIREVATGGKDGKGKVGITGFGTFQRVTRAARIGRNPRTGDRVKIKKTVVPKFKAGTAFSTNVADPRTLPKTTAAGARASAGTRVSAAKVVAKKAAPAKAAAKKAAPAKVAAKKASPAKVVAKKVVPAKAVAKKAAPVKAAAKKAAPVKAAAKKAAPAKAVAKKAAPAKAVAKKAAPAKAVAKKVAPAKAAAKKTARRA